MQPAELNANLDEEVLLELGGGLLVSLALGALLYEGVEVKPQVAHLVAQVLTSLSPAASALALGNKFHSLQRFPSGGGRARACPAITNTDRFLGI